MKCQICKENDAVVHVQQIMGEDVVELHLCEACAREKGISSHSDSIELSLSQLLTGLIDTRKAGSSAGAAELCPKCGRKLSDVRKEGTLGCGSCFSQFRREITAGLERIAPGGARHKGRFPARLLTYKALLMDKEALKKDLAEALAEEDYERAAEIRDRIRAVESMAEGRHG